MVIQDKVAIITGASSGIGLETAKLLTAEGAKVAIVARSKDKLEALAETLKDSQVVVADMSKESDVRRMVQEVLSHYGRIDILVNNAGRGYDTFVEKIDIEMYRDLIELNLISPLIAMQEVVPHMRKQGEGAIVNITSGTSLMDIPNIGAYSSVKRALNGLTLTARAELAKDNIAVSLVYPYVTNTDFGKNVMGGARYETPTDRDSTLPPADPPQYIAQKVIEAIQTGEAEILAHDWMKKIK